MLQYYTAETELTPVDVCVICWWYVKSYICTVWVVCVILYSFRNVPKAISIKCFVSQAKLNSPETTLIHIADTLARIATTERGLSLFLYERNLVSGEGEG